MNGLQLAFAKEGFATRLCIIDMALSNLSSCHEHMTSDLCTHLLSPHPSKAKR